MADAENTRWPIGVRRGLAERASQKEIAGIWLDGDERVEMNALRVLFQSLIVDLLRPPQ